MSKRSSIENGAEREKKRKSYKIANVEFSADELKRVFCTALKDSSRDKENTTMDDGVRAANDRVILKTNELQNSNPNPTTVSDPNTEKAVFDQYSNRFDGNATDPDHIENFLQDLLKFMKQYSISDNTALEQLAVLLTDVAAVWWNYVKSLITTWDEAVRLLRLKYGVPSHKILQDILAQEQAGESTNSFVMRVRRELLCLPYQVPERMEFDIICGLITKGITRDNLLSGIQTILAMAKTMKDSPSVKESYLPNQNVGNCVNNNNKSKNKQIIPASNIYDSVRPTTIDSSTNMSCKQIIEPVQCSSCNQFGHNIDQCKNKIKNQDNILVREEQLLLSCYVCGQQGVIYSECPLCKTTISDIQVDNESSVALVPTPSPSRQFEALSVDLIGPLPKTSTGKQWLLVVEDVCSQWVELFALENSTSTECAQVLISEVFLRFGIPNKMVSGKGVEFGAKVMQHVCHVFDIEQIPHHSYHYTDSKYRNLTHRLLLMLGKDLKSWDTNLPAIRFAMNSFVSSCSGFSPGHLAFGRQLPAAFDVAAKIKTIVDDDKFSTVITPSLRNLATTLSDVKDIHELFESIHK